MSTVAVLGAGKAGTAFARAIARNGHTVRLWSVEPDVLEEIRQRHTNTKYLPGVRLPPQVEARPEIAQALDGAEMVLIAVPTQAVRTVARQAAPHLRPGQTVLNVAKGLEAKTRLRMSQLLMEELPSPLRSSIASMGGPAIAAEIVRDLTTAVIIGAPRSDVARRIQEIMQGPSLKVETTEDTAGVEVGATLKNIYAIALGMCDGLGESANTKAFLTTLALAEMAMLLPLLGGQTSTAYGLAGLGDLVTTGFSPHSRNRTLGERLCAGPDWRRFLETDTVEGVAACQAVKEMLKGAEVRTPLLDLVHDVLFQGSPPVERMRRFLREFAFEGPP